eukprot:scaffold1353_cov161-Amphora_coffeaeformis.AAC.2
MAPADYQPCQGGVAPTPNGERLHTDGMLVMVLPVYTSIFGNMSERLFYFNRPHSYSTSPLVWGSIHALISPILRKASWRQVKWVPYLAAYILIHDHPNLDEKIGDWKILIAFVLVALGWLWDALIVNRVTRETAAAVDQQVNPVLSFFGYRADYKIESTGECYTKEHRIYVYTEESNAGSLTDKELVARIPRETGQGVREPTIVYLYGTPYQNLISWQCGSRPHHMTDPCPIPGIPLAVWGALQDAMRVQRVADVQWAYLINLIVWSCFAIFFSFPTQDWIVTLVIFAPVFLMIVWCAHSRLATATRNVGHPQWQQATSHWQGIIAEFGWQMEYHHGSLEATCCTSPDFWLRFVPVSGSPWYCNCLACSWSSKYEAVTCLLIRAARCQGSFSIEAYVPKLFIAATVVTIVPTLITIVPYLDSSARNEDRYPTILGICGNL